MSDQFPAKLIGRFDSRECIVHTVGGLYGSSFGMFNEGYSINRFKFKDLVRRKRKEFDFFY